MPNSGAMTTQRLEKRNAPIILIPPSIRPVMARYRMEVRLFP